MLQGSYAAIPLPFYVSTIRHLRIGNDRIYLQASANLALSFARLGEYEKAIEWADRAFEFHKDV